MARSGQNVAALTGVRAVAAGLVFFYHWFFTHAAAWPLPLRAPFDVGYVGVPIFFALSGFLISVRYTTALAAQRISYRQYWLNRFARLYPLYFFVLTAFVALPHKGLSLADGRAVLVAYTLTQAFFPSLLLAGVAVGWTLTLEFAFYICAPALMGWLNAAASRRLMLARAGGLSAVSIGLAWASASLPLPSAWQGSLLGAPLTWVLHYTILGHLPDFVAGVAAGLIFLRAQARPPAGASVHLLIGGGMLGVYAAMVGLDTIAAEYGSPLNRLLGIGVAVCSSLLFLGLAWDVPRTNPITRWLGARWMVYLGTISYALYLIQLTEPSQWLFWIFLGQTLGVADLILRAMLLYPLDCILAAVLYHFIEQPAEQRLRRLARPAPLAAPRPSD